MADLRIVDAPVLLQESITDDVKMPTGGLGNFSIRLGDIVWYVVQKEQLATKAYVNQKDNLKADKATTLSGYGIADAYNKNETYSKTEINTSLSSKASVNYVDSKDGDLTTLKTVNKTTLVQAVNEVYDSSKGVVDLYGKNVAAGAGANGWAANLVTYGEITQKQVNDGLDSVAAMLAIQNPRNGQRVYVNSYHTPNYALLKPYKGGGAFVYDASKANVNDGGMVMNGWVRADYTDVTPELFGAKGDLSTDDTQAIQKAINFAKVGIKLLDKYKITDTLIVNNKHYFAISGVGRDCGIYNTAAEKTALKYIDSESCSLSDFCVIGDGTGFYSTDATTGHGIEFENSPLPTLNNVTINKHGKHGVYVSRGGWCFYFVNCKINFNKLDGINALAAAGGSEGYYQNGNNLSCVNTEMNGNGNSAMRWHALALNINGCLIERNGTSGIFIDNSSYPVSSWGINIVGNYFEANKDCCIRLLSAENALIDGLNINGNFFTGGSPFPNDGSYIKAEGVYGYIRNGSIRGNTMNDYGTNYLVDGGNMLHSSVRVESTYRTKNMGAAKIETGSKKRVITGATSAKGVTWSSMAGDSDNFFSSSSVNVIYFALPADSETVFNNFKFIVKSDTTAPYTVTSYLTSIDENGTEQDLSGYVATASNGGSIGVQHDVLMHGVENTMFLKVLVGRMSNGTTAKITNPIMSFN